jgi:hypothetical protein
MNIPIWPGSSSFFPGVTPFGFYDYDSQFQIDADKVANFCARRLGYPIVDIELQDINFYAAFEEAITTYGNEVFAYQVIDNYLSLEGVTPPQNLNNTLITPSMITEIRLAQQYGVEAGVGGNVTWYYGYIPLTSSVQDYNLSTWATQNGISGGIEIKQVYFYDLPAVNQMYAPFGGFAGLGGVPAAGLYGGMYGGGYGGGYMMMPVAYDAGVIQGIELSNTIRLSSYTFQIINNNLRIFPVPTDDDAREGYLWFNYIKLTDRADNSLTQVSGSNGITPGTVTNPSNVPYANPVYTQINSIGKQWIYEFTLALCKEMLGYVRGKYSTVPIPDREVTLNQADLLSAATSEKLALIERLRGYLDSTSKQSLLERKRAEGDAMKQNINNVPMCIFIG